MEEETSNLDFTARECTIRDEGNFPDAGSKVDSVLEEAPLDSAVKALQAVLDDEEKTENDIFRISDDFWKAVEWRTTPFDYRQVAQDFREGNNGAHPVNTPINPDLWRYGEQNPKKKVRVFNASIGGTNVVVEGGEFSYNAGLNVTTLENNTVEKSYESAEAFLAALYSDEVLRDIKKSAEEAQKEGESVIISLVPGFPIDWDPEAEGYVVDHFAGKYSISELGRHSPEDSAPEHAPTLNESLTGFLTQKIPGQNNIRVEICPNDTIAASFGYRRSDNDKGKRRGCLIAGTGGNASLGNINTEMGHYHGVPFSLLDRKFFEENGKPADFESMFSGKVLGKMFMATLERIFNGNDEVMEKIRSEEEDENKLLFSLAGLSQDRNISELNLTKKERSLVWHIATEYINRAAHYTAVGLAAVEEAFADGNPVVFCAEGSLVTKNHDFVQKINVEYQDITPDQRGNVLVSREVNAKDNSGKEGKMDGSGTGGAVFAGLNHLKRLAEAA